MVLNVILRAAWAFLQLMPMAKILKTLLMLSQVIVMMMIVIPLTSPMMKKCFTFKPKLVSLSIKHVFPINLTFCP